MNLFKILYSKSDFMKKLIFLFNYLLGRNIRYKINPISELDNPFFYIPNFYNIQFAD